MALSIQDKKLIARMIEKECSRAVSTAENIFHAPEACCIIDVIAILACCTKDPSLRSGEKSEIFKHLKTPDSFKASLYQVINAMCSAFRKAYTSMDKIQLNLNGMPQLMQDSLEALDQLEDPNSQDIIDHALYAIKNSANKCVQSAQEADDECKAALEVIEELLQAALATQGRSEHRSEAAKFELEEQKLLRIQKEKLLKDLEQQENEQKQIVRDAMDDYKMRMSQSTEFSSVVGAMFLDNLNTLVISIGKTAENMSAIVGSLPANVISTIKTQMDSSKTYFNKDDLLNQAMENVLLELLEDITKAPTEEVAAEVDGHINNLKTANSYKTVSEMGKMLRKTCKNFIDGLQNLKRNEQDSRKNYEAAKNAAILYLKAYEKANEQSTDSIEPDAIKHMSSEERQVLMKTRVENLKITKQNMAAEREIYEKLRKEKITADEKLCEIISNMERLEMEEVDLKNVVHYLRQGIQQLSKVQIAWGNIVAFFNHIKNTVDGPLIEHIEGMTTSVEQITEGQHKSVTTFKRRILLREITKACAVANVLMQSAELYKTIHVDYVKPTIDKSIISIGLSQAEAQARQYDIVSKFSKIRDSVQNTIEFHAQTLPYKVYEAMQEQGFDVDRAIEDKKTKKVLRLRTEQKESE